jgi:predicted Zn-dependent peptidase
VPAPFRAYNPRVTSAFVQHTLPNGLTVVCEVLEQVRSAAIAFLVRTGARHEPPGLFGVSHFLEHMCFKGTARRCSREINVRFDELGSIYNAYTGKEHTIYYGWVPAARLSDQLELLADLLRPCLPPEEFETERRVILEEIAMSDDNFERHVWDFLHREAFKDHGLAHEILGDQQTIGQLTREALRNYYQRRYTADNLVVLASGAIEPEEVFAGVGRYCAQWKPGRDGPLPSPNPPPLPTGTRKLRLERFTQQSVALVYPSVARGHPAEESIEAFLALFGGPNSRCYWNIVQKGICSFAGAAWVAYSDCGLLALYADGPPDRCEEMLAALREQAEQVSAKGFSEQEVRRVRNQRRTQLALEAENPRTRLMQMVDDLESLGYVRTVDARLAAAQAVTPETIADYLRQYPITGEGLLLSCGPRDWPAD